VTPTIWFPAPSSYSVSVALGRKETIRIRRAMKKFHLLKM
jgi:hypothetical protein